MGHAPSVQLQTFPAGHTLMVQGESGEYAYILTEGTIKVSADEFNEPITLQPGALIGDGILLGQATRRYSAQATSECTVICVPPNYLTKSLAHDQIAAHITGVWGHSKLQLPTLNSLQLPETLHGTENRYVSNTVIDRISLAHNFRNALEGRTGEIRMHFQPITDLETGKVVCLEALMRWFPKDGAPISPGVFIPAIETTDIITPASRWGLEDSCVQLRSIIDATGRDDLSVAFNVTPQDLSTPNFASNTLNAVNAAGLSPQNLCIEITERTAFDDENNAPEVLRRLEQHGIQSAIDDYGEGHSSLGRLVDLDALTKLKVDIKFVRAMMTEDRSRRAVQSAIGLAHNFGLSVVAEGIETDEQATALIDLQCDQGQGYGLGKPMSAEEIIQHLQLAA